jgi:hypothetical protein
VFEMAAPIQSPAKWEVRFLNAKGERPAEMHKQIVAVYSNVMNRQNVTNWCREFSEGRTDVHDEQRSGTPSLIWLAAKFYDSGIQKLVPRLNPGPYSTRNPLGHLRLLWKTFTFMEPEGLLSRLQVPDTCPYP